MELTGIFISIAVVAAFSAIPFCIFNNDAKRVAGTSTYTNALLYRKLVDENKLTRMQIRALEQQKVRDQAGAVGARLRRWEQSQNAFCSQLHRSRRA